MSDVAKNPVDIHGHSFNRWSVAFLVLIGAFVSILMETALGTAVPSIMSAFDVNFATAQTLTTAYMLANGMMIPLAAFLISRVPSKTLYTLAMGVMFLGTLLAAFTPNDSFGLLLTARVLQALALGVAMPLMQVIFLNIFPAEQRGAAMGLTGVVMMLGPAIGPTLSGWLLTGKHNFFGYEFHGDWHAIFMVVLPIAAVAFLLSFFFLRDVLPTQKVKLDVRSLFESVIGFGLVLYAFNNVAEHGWGNLTSVVLPMIVGVLVVAEFAWHQTRMAEPFLDIRIFANVQFLKIVVLGAIMMAAMLGVEMILPTFLQNIKQLSALDSGLALLPGAIVIGILAPLAGVLYDKFGIRLMGTVGFVLLLAGTLPLTTITQDTATWTVVAYYTLRMAGIGLVMMPVFTMAMNTIKPEQTTHGTVSQNTFNQVASALSTAVLSSVVASVTKSHLPNKSLAVTDQAAYAKKAMAATIDGFHASFWIAVGVTVVGLILLYMIPNKVTPHPNSGETPVMH
ncbi:MAG TPA: MDR family MFS transporter [Lactobacillaceae bacterium]